MGLEPVEPFGLPRGISPEDVLHYAYGVVFAPTYRERYASYLRSHFPRIPLPTDAGNFRALTELGRRLVDLHLLRDEGEFGSVPSFDVGGDRLVQDVRFEPDSSGGGRVWINDRQFFDGVSCACWRFTIGGYQVLEKWLKDRRGRVLSVDDVAHYRKTVGAIYGTLRLQAEADVAFLELIGDGTAESGPEQAATGTA